MVKKEIRIYIEGAGRGVEAVRMRGGVRKFLDQLFQIVQPKGFNENALPKSPVEQIAVKDLIDGLKKATATTTKGKYHKTKHAPEILKKLNVAKVRQAAPYCDRLFKTLAEKMDANS